MFAISQVQWTVQYMINVADPSFTSTFPFPLSISCGIFQRYYHINWSKYFKDVSVRHHGNCQLWWKTRIKVSSGHHPLWQHQGRQQISSTRALEFSALGNNNNNSLEWEFFTKICHTEKNSYTLKIHLSFPDWAVPSAFFLLGLQPHNTNTEEKRGN